MTVDQTKKKNKNWSKSDQDLDWTTWGPIYSPVRSLYSLVLVQPVRATSDRDRLASGNLEELCTKVSIGISQTTIQGEGAYLHKGKKELILPFVSGLYIYTGDVSSAWKEGKLRLLRFSLKWQCAYPDTAQKPTCGPVLVLVLKKLPQDQTRPDRTMTWLSATRRVRHQAHWHYCRLGMLQVVQWQSESAALKVCHQSISCFGGANLGAYIFYSLSCLCSLCPLKVMYISAGADTWEMHLIQCRRTHISWPKQADNNNRQQLYSN